MDKLIIAMYSLTKDPENTSPWYASGWDRSGKVVAETDNCFKTRELAEADIIGKLKSKGYRKIIESEQSDRF